MTNVRIAQLTQLVYDNQLVRKRTDTIYVCTDSHNIYFGFDLIFQEDDYKIMLIDYDEFTIRLTAYGPSGSETISITEYQTTNQAVQAIKELVEYAYRLVGNINSSGITQDLLIANNLGNVYNVTEPFDVTNENKNLFVDSVQLGRYPQNSKILVTNAGTEENPIYKFNISAQGTGGGGNSGGGSSINVKPDWNALPGSDAEILNKPNIPSKTSELTNDSGYLTQEADPTVPSWAKQNSKPNYNLDEVSDGNTRKIPTNISDLNNDSGFTANIGTITSVKMNGSTVSSNGEADLGIVITSHQDISGKADKVSNATSGDLAGLDNNGNLTDSGVSPSNIAYIGSSQSSLITPLNPEFASNKKSTLNGYETSEQYYPNMKALFDALGKWGVVSQTLTKNYVSGSASNGIYITTSNPICGLIPNSFIDIVTEQGAVFNNITGYFELNGITDIAYDEMRTIYASITGYGITSVTSIYGSSYNARTNFPIFRGASITYYNHTTFYTKYIGYENSMTEILSLCPDGNTVYFFASGANNSSKNYALREIKGIMGCDNINGTPYFRGDAYNNFPMLESFRFKNLHGTVKFIGMPRLTNETIAYSISNATSAATTITVDSAVYDRASVDPEVQSALANKTNVTLASA